MVGDNVVIPGWIEKEQIFSLMANASLGVAPYIDSMNYRLNTPNKFGEYLSAGLPIAVSVSGEMENLLKKYNCGCYYRNAEELIKIVDLYFRDSKLTAQHSHNAKKLYEDMFNADKTNEKLLNHIIKISKKEKRE